MLKAIMFTLFFLISNLSLAKDYEIFDGRVYNNKYYPVIDVITWNQKKGDPYTLHFNVYWKGHALDMSYKLDDSGSQKVMLVRYNIKERNESLCRRIPAPGNFGPNFKVYKDVSDKDMDKFVLSMEPIKKDTMKEISPAPYEACPEEKEEETNAAGRDPNDPNSYKVTPTPVATKSTEPTSAPAKTKEQQDQEKLNTQYNLFN